MAQEQENLLQNADAILKNLKSNPIPGVNQKQTGNFQKTISSHLSMMTC